MGTEPDTSAPRPPRLALVALGGRAEGDHLADARGHGLGDARDDASLACVAPVGNGRVSTGLVAGELGTRRARLTGGVAALEDDDDF